MAGRSRVTIGKPRRSPKPRRKGPSDLEVSFANLWAISGNGMRPVREWRPFENLGHRFDFAWPTVKVAVELEGGIWTEGRHLRGAGFIKDAEKYNLATEYGWAILRYTTNHLRSDPVGVAEQVKRTIAARLTT